MVKHIMSKKKLIEVLIAEGKTNKEITDVTGVSRQRVHQLRYPSCKVFDYVRLKTKDTPEYAVYKVGVYRTGRRGKFIMFDPSYKPLKVYKHVGV